MTKNLRFRKINFSILVALFFGIVSIIYAFTETSRLAPDFQSLYFNLKIIYGLLGFFFAAYFYFFDATDTSYFLLMVTFLSYCLVFMWLAPLYEIAYLEMAIASSFFRLKRPWLFASTFFLGLLGIFATYFAQDRTGWVLPPIARSDWYSTVVIFFILAWLIQKFVLQAHQKDQDRLSRFGIIGKEATRLTHDIKGLLSSPLLIVESLKNHKTIPAEDFEKQMVHLTEDMENVREVIKSIHRLINIDDRSCPLEITEVIQGPMLVFERRLAPIKVYLPSQKTIQGNPDRLHSIFFNLFLNSIEAFEKNKTQNPQIDICWQGRTLVFRDNAGAAASKSHGSGIGLDLVRTDLEKIGAKFKATFKSDSTQIEMKFLT